MRSFAARSTETEWMDGDAVSPAEFAACLRDLAAVNTATLARRPTLRWLAEATHALPAGASFTLLDVGYGEGDMLRVIHRWATRRGLRPRLIGVDLNPRSEPAARAATDPALGIDYRTGDVFACDPAEPVDFIVSSLVTHHLTDRQVGQFLMWMEARSVRGWFVNDLRRSPIAFYGFTALAAVMRWHPFVRHDGPVSVARSFVPDEWERALANAGITAGDGRAGVPLPPVRRPAQAGGVVGGGIVVAGGGLAGAAAATRLARAGRRPLLLERTTGPHDKICGDFVSTEAQAHLAALGFDAGALGGAPIDRIRLVAGERVAAAKLPFTALGLTRRRLDAALLDHAAASGVEVERGVTVRQVAGATLATSGGDLTPAALLLATGKAEVRGAKRATAGTLDHLIGFKQYYRAGPATLADLAGVIEIVLFDGGYAGVQRVEDGLVNLCLLVDRRRFDASGGDVLAGLLASEPRLARLLGEATPQLARPLTISGVPYGFVHQGDGADATAFRLGDQVGVIPSFTGDGMAIALHSAGLAAAAVLAGASPAAYHAAFRRDCARQIGRATALQRLGEGRTGRRLLVGGIGLLPGLLRWAAAATRVPPAALHRAGLDLTDRVSDPPGRGVPAGAEPNT